MGITLHLTPSHHPLQSQFKLRCLSFGVFRIKKFRQVENLKQFYNVPKPLLLLLRKGGK